MTNARLWIHSPSTAAYLLVLVLVACSCTDADAQQHSWDASLRTCMLRGAEFSDTNAIPQPAYRLRAEGVVRLEAEAAAVTGPVEKMQAEARQVAGASSCQTVHTVERAPQ